MGADPTGFKQYPPQTSGTHGPSLSSVSTSLSQANPSFPPQPRSYWQLGTHCPDFQFTPAHADHPVPSERRTSSSTFPVHPWNSQFSSGPHTPFSSFPAQYQYAMSTQPVSLLNQPSQPMYHVYRPIEPTPVQYFPFQDPQPQPYPPPPSSYEQARLPPPPLPHFTASSPGSSHANSYGGAHQYLPSIYSPGGPFRQSQPYRHPYQWYRGPGPPADMFVEGNMHVQPHSPLEYPYPHPQRPHNSSTQVAQSAGPSLALSNSPVSVTASRSTLSPPASDPPKHVSVQSSPRTNTHQPSQETLASNPRAQKRPVVRRQYHPNPPPNRSQWVMWIGNIPRDASSDELWQFLKQPVATSSGPEGNSGVEDNGVISIFLISRSNCAFANYQSEAQLHQAISKFSGRKLRPHDRRCPRLVCRARRMEGELRAGVGGQRGRGVHTNYVKNVLENGGTGISLTASEETMGHQPETSDSQPAHSSSKDAKAEGANKDGPTQSPASYASTSSSFLNRYFPKRFFILKSLSQIDLDLSTKQGVWATQKHNEAILDQAFRTSKEVILVFSVNRSGEFYGYARMASRIFRGNHDVWWAPRAEPSVHTTPPLTSRVPTHSSTKCFPRENRTLPSEQSSVHPSSSPFATSSESKDCESTASSPGTGVDSSPGRRSESHSPKFDPEGSPTSDPSPWSRSISSRQRWSQVRDPPWGGDPPTPISTSEYPGTDSEDCGPEDSSSRELSEKAPVKDDPPQTRTLRAEMAGDHGNQEADAGWGDPFEVEWLSTEPVRFHRTRNLRNPWNHGREIKVSRDGTELEPVVGQRLVDSWSTLANSSASGDDAKRTAAGTRDGRHSKFGPSTGLKGVREETS